MYVSPVGKPEVVGSREIAQLLTLKTQGKDLGTAKPAQGAIFPKIRVGFGRPFTISLSPSKSIGRQKVREAHHTGLQHGTIYFRVSGAAITPNVLEKSRPKNPFLNSPPKHDKIPS